MSETARLAEEGARSIFGFLERKAERREDGVRWETLDWGNEAQYTPFIFTGSGGVPFFLADYYRVTGERRALELAEGGVRWCASPEREAWKDPEEEWCRNGIMRGRSGLGLAWLCLAAASGNKKHLGEAAKLGEGLLKAQIGPVTDWQDGAAGELLFLLRLGEATGEGRFIDSATARAAWLEAVSIREGVGRIWPWQTDHEVYAKWRGLSFVPGAAGIAYVLACLYERTRAERWATVVRETAVTLRREGREEKGGLNWPDTQGGFEKGEAHKCQWCHGASGDGLFLTKAFAALGDVELGRLARAAGEATYGFGDVRRNPCLCHGLAGNASLFLDLAAATGDDVWSERAGEFARLIMGYREKTPEGDLWQSDDPGCHSPDFLYGVSGTGHLLLRLWRPDVVGRVPIL